MFAGWLLVVGVWLSLPGGVGCEQSGSDSVPASGVAAPAKSPKLASLVPAATDLLVAMGAGDHLVAVSNWDTPRPQIAHLPRVGDYQTTDWEQLAQLRPDVMIVFMAAERMPAGLKQRADALGIRLVNVRTETVRDILQTIRDLGELTGEPQKAAALEQKIQSQLDTVARRVAGRQPVPTLLVRDEAGFALIGGDTFVDDVLKIAGGTNVASHLPVRYPTVDREQVLEMAPQAIVQLMPDAPPGVVDRARRAWQQMPQLPAVRQQRVFILTDWYVLQPGSHVGDLAEQICRLLHPSDAPATAASD